MPLVGGDHSRGVFRMNGQRKCTTERKHYMDSREHPGSNVTACTKSSMPLKPLKVMEQAVPGLRGAKVVMITDHTPTGNGLTKQFEIELRT